MLTSNKKLTTFAPDNANQNKNPHQLIIWSKKEVPQPKTSEIQDRKAVYQLKDTELQRVTTFPTFLMATGALGQSLLNVTFASTNTF